MSLCAQAKTKQCKSCGASFTPFMPMAVACSPICALTIGREKTAKKLKAAQVQDRKETKQKLDKLKSKSQWAREAQTAFNAWVRARDAGQPCISCGRHHQGQNHAGHYLSVGARPELRYEPLNVNLQCAPCNTYLSGNVALYRVGLVLKIGVEDVEWLEGPHEPKKYMVDDYKAIKAEYALATKQLKE